MTDKIKSIDPLEPEKWETKQRILVILAHPDDPEFFCGGSLARWTAAGHEVVYWLLTCGDKGTSDISMTAEQVCGDRHQEQRNAAAVLGVQEVNFLDLPDGYLVPDMELRRQVVGMIRREKPDILVTCDPTTLLIGDNRINHPDHRAAGQVVLDAVFPAAHMHLYFPELLAQGLEPHRPREVWVCGSLQPSVKLDVTDMWETKINALYEHVSQIGDPVEFTQRMRERRTVESTPEQPRYEEGFRRIIFG